MDEQILKNNAPEEAVIPAENETPVTEGVEEAEVIKEAETIEETEEIEKAETVEETEEIEEAEEIDENDPLAHAFENYTVEQPKPKRWPIVVLSILLVIALVAGSLYAAGAFDHLKPQTDDKGSNVGSTDVSDLVAMSTENFTITNGMLSFDIEYWYQSFASYYGSYLSYFGLDTTKPLKDQAAYSGEGTWFDYFAANARNDAEYLLVMNEAAKKNGITLGASAQKLVEEYLVGVDLSTFHNGVTAEDIKAFWTMYYTASTQENALHSSINVTEDMVNAHYNKNPAAYQVCDYVCFNVPASFENASDIVDDLAASTTPAEFRQKVIDYLVKAKKYASADEAGAAYDANAAVKAATYNADDGISPWLFAADTKVGATRTVTGSDSSVTVYMLTAAPTRNTDKVVNIRHILVTADTYGSDDAAKQKAEALLAEWQKGDATAASFGALASEYTEDSNGAAGGLYTGVTQGQMVESFDAWCFDSTRKHGDTGIVKTDSGYHVMYFEAAPETWYHNAWNTLVSEQYNALYESLYKAYPITVNEENIAKIEL